MTDYLENLEQQEEIFPFPEETPTVEQEDASGEPEEKVKRRTRRRKAETTEEETPVEPHSAEPEGIDTIPLEKETSALQETEQEGPVEPEEADAPRRSRRTVTLDSYGNVIREPSDSGLRDISILTAARNARRILTATIDAIEADGDTMPRAVFYLGSVKVVIPFAQMGFDLDRGAGNQREARLFMGSMLGAKIDYMVRGIDTKARIAAASRRDAMLVRQASILNARAPAGSTASPKECGSPPASSMSPDSPSGWRSTALRPSFPSTASPISGSTTSGRSSRWERSARWRSYPWSGGRMAG